MISDIWLKIIQNIQRIKRKHKHQICKLFFCLKRTFWVDELQRMIWRLFSDAFDDKPQDEDAEWLISTNEKNKSHMPPSDWDNPMRTILPVCAPYHNPEKTNINLI